MAMGRTQPGRLLATTSAAAPGLPAFVPRERATATRTASVPMVWYVATTTALGEMGMTAANSVVQMLVTNGRVLLEGNVMNGIILCHLK